MGTYHRAFLAATLCGAATLATPALAAAAEPTGNFDANASNASRSAAENDGAQMAMNTTSHHRHAYRHRASASENQSEIETTRQLNAQAAKDAAPSQ